MSITNPDNVVTKEMLSDFYRYILPYLGGGLSPTTNYSTLEQRIGTWIDGKPVYQKTYIFDSFKYTSSWKAWDLGFQSGEIDVYIDCRTAIQLSSSEFIPLPYAQSSEYTMTCYINTSTNALYVKSETSRTGILHTTIQYTKSTV